MRKTLFSATIPATVANTMFAQLPPSAAWTPHNKGQQSNGYGKKLSPAITANAKYPYPVTAMVNLSLKSLKKDRLTQMKLSRRLWQCMQRECPGVTLKIPSKKFTVQKFHRDLFHASRKEDYNDIADEIFRLREMKQKNFTDTAVRDEQVKRINELNEFIEQQNSELTEFDESLAQRWLKEIIVWDNRITIELKSDVSIDADA